jgi:hypothetical protein
VVRPVFICPTKKKTPDERSGVLQRKREVNKRRKVLPDSYRALVHGAAGSAMPLQQGRPWPKCDSIERPLPSISLERVTDKCPGEGGVIRRCLFNRPTMVHIHGLKRHQYGLGSRRFGNVPVTFV